MQGEYKIRHKPDQKVFNTVLKSLHIGASEQEARLELISRHRSTLQQKCLEEQVNQIVERLVIPKEWYELILAYYLNDKGMSDFELRSFNLRQELTRQRELFKRGHISQAEYEQAYLFIDRRLQRLQPSAQLEARQAVPLLKDFNSLWQQMTLPKKRAIYRAESDFAGNVCRVIF